MVKFLAMQYIILLYNLYVGDIIQLGDKVTFRFNHLSTHNQVSFMQLLCINFVLDLSS